MCAQLRDEGVDLSRLHHVGCSAGAIAAVLAASGVDFDRAWAVAMAHLERNGALQHGSKACAGASKAGAAPAVALQEGCRKVGARL